MRLALKLMSAVVVTLIVLLALHSYLLVVREIHLFQQDMERRAYLLGKVLASSAADIWRTGGSERVFDIIKDANSSEGALSVRWVWFDAPDHDPFAPQVKPDDLSELTQGHEIWVQADDSSGAGHLFAYFPVAVDSTRLSALELAQPTAPMVRYIRATIIRSILLLLTFVVLGGAAVWWLGAVMVGRPVQEMVTQARRVGTADFSARAVLRGGHDELSELGSNFNRMAESLEEFHMKLQAETARRFETSEQLHHAERLATVGKLASGLAHELGTPLNVVSGRAQMLATESDQMSPAEVSENALIIKDQGERMTRLVRQLLDFARRRRPAKSPTRLDDVVATVAAMLRPLASQRNVTLRTQVSPALPPVLIDRGQLEQVLSNLVVNAVHAMPQGGPVDIVTAAEEASPPADHGGAPALYACIRVVDRGVGIAAEDQSRIFTPFFSTKDVGEGTGLGLSIAHGIVEEHAGWIAVQSVPGEGSTFEVYLPLGLAS